MEFRVNARRNSKYAEKKGSVRKNSGHFKSNIKYKHQIIRVDAMILQIQLHANVALISIILEGYVCCINLAIYSNDLIIDLYCFLLVGKKQR